MSNCVDFVGGGGVKRLVTYEGSIGISERGEIPRRSRRCNRGVILHEATGLHPLNR
jgi:hypothetical protein